jgi:hypothetical protein
MTLPNLHTGAAKTPYSSATPGRPGCEILKRTIGRTPFHAYGSVDRPDAPARILEQGRVGWAELDPASKRIPSFLGGG